MRTPRAESCPCRRLSLPERSQEWASLSRWKSQPGSWRLGKGRALKINRSLSLAAAGGRLVSEAAAGRSCGPWLARPSPGAASWAAGPWEGLVAGGRREYLIPGSRGPRPRPTCTYTLPCTPHTPRPGKCSTECGRAVPEDRAGIWDVWSYPSQRDGDRPQYR